MRKALQFLSFLTTILLFTSHLALAQCDDIAPDGPFCQGDVITFTASGSSCNGMKDWAYDLNDGNGVVEESSINLELTLTNSGTITVSILDAPGGSTVVTENYTVNAKPSNTAEVNLQDGSGWVMTNTAEVCEGHTEIRLRGILNQTGASFIWNDPSGTQISTSRRLELFNLTAADAGTYENIYTDPNGCMDTITIDVIVNPLPDVTVATMDENESYCSGQAIPDLTFGITGASPYNITYTLDGGSPTTVNSVTSPFNISNATPGVYRITAVTDANGCSTIPGFMSDPITLTENPTPDVTMPSSNEILSYCTGQSIPDISFTLSGNGPFSVTYTIDGGSSTTETSQSSPFVISNGSTGTYVITSITSADGCTTAGGYMSNSITLVETSSPDVSSPSSDDNLSYCQGEAVPDISFSFTGTGPFNVTYTIDGGSSTTVNSQPSPLVISNGTPGVYVITSIVDATGCSTSPGYMSNSITLTENQNPDVMPQYNLFDGNGWIFGNSVSLCEGEELGLAAHPVDPNGYTWSGPNGFSSNTRVLNFNPITANENGSFNVTYVDPNGCSDTDVIIVTVNELPTPSISVTDDSGTANNDGIICDGDDVTLLASGGTMYAWNDINNTNTPNLTVSPSTNTTYTVTVTDVNGCEAVTSSSITVNNTPSVTFPGAGPFCVNDNATQLSATPGGSNGTYSGNGITNPNNGTFDPSVAGVGMHTITYTFENNNDCVDSESIVIIVNDLPTVSLTSVSPLCENNNSIVLSASPSGGTFSGPGITDVNNGTFDPSVAGDGNHDITYTFTDGNNCTNTDMITITVNELPTASISGDAEVCEGDANQTVTISASNGTGPYIYTYDLNGTEISSPATGNTFNITQTTNVPDIYTFTLVSVEDANGCIAMLSGSVVVNVKPNPTLVLNGNPVCSPDLLTYSLSFISDGTVSSTVGTVDNVANTVTGIPAMTPVTLTSILNDCVSTLFVPFPDCNCPMDIEPPVDATDPDDLEICFGDNNSTLSVTVEGSNLSANWYLDEPNGGIPLNSSPSLSYTPPASISAADSYAYFVETVDVNSGCVSIARTPIIYIIHELPTPEITPDNPIICDNTSVVLDAGNPGNFDEFLWNDNSMNQTLEVSLPANYSVTVTDTNGCTGTDAVTVGLHPNPTVSFPTNDIIVEYCENDSAPTIEFNLNPGNGNIVSAQYTFNNGAPINGSVSGNVLTITNAVEGQYKVVFLEDAECSTSAGFESATITVVELNEPVFTIQKSPTNNSLVCEGDDFTLTPSLTGSQYEYSWEYPGNGTSNAASISFFDVDASFTGTYSCTITDTSSDEMCTSVSSREVVVSVVEGQLTTDENGETDICLGESITLIADGVDGSVTWLNDVPTGQENDFTVEVSPTMTTTYNAILENSDECTRDESITITVNSLPNPVLESDQDEYCDNDEAILSTTNNFGQIVWSDGEMGQNNTVEVNLFNTDYQVTVTNNSGCTATASIDLTVYSNPVVGISTPAQNIPAGEEATFDFKDPETDPACGVQFYNWTVTGPGVNESGSTTEEFFDFTFDQNGIYEVCVVLVDDCNMCMSDPSCLIMDIDDNTSCKVNFSPQGNNCAGECSTLVANPIPGTNPGANIPQLGVFIIEGITIDANYPLGIIDEGDNGLPFEIKEKWSTDEVEFIDSIIVIFHDPGQYNFSFELDYGNCEKTVGPVAAVVQDVPNFSDVLIDDEICFGEEAIVDFIVPSESEDFVLSYTINDGLELTKNFSGSNDDIQFTAPGTLPATLNIELVDLVNFVDNQPVGCFNDEIMPSAFTINFLEEVTYTVIDSCNDDLTEVQYFIELEGGTGDYSLDGVDVDGNEFETDFFPSGQSQTLTLVDEGCDEDNSEIISLSSSCETCTPLDELVEEQSIIVDGNQNVCENDIVTFTMDKMPEISPTQLVVYTVQRTSSQFYDEDNVILDSIPSDPTVFEFDINSADFTIGEVYYISAYIFSEVASGFKPDEECEGIVARTLTFYSSPVAELVNLEDDSNICINEFDFQVGLDNGVTSSTFTSSDPDNINVAYIEGTTRALIDVGDLTDETITITLNQSINHTTTEGILECSDQDDLVLNVLDKVAPSKDTIIGFPGNLFTFVADGFCYQWGLNDDELEGETERFLIADQELTEDDILWINVWDCSDTELECVSTIYYNAFEPPLIEVDPNKALEYNLYPNPNDGIFTLELDGPQVGTFNANLFDATGQLIKAITFEKEDVIHNQVISLEQAATGLYLLQVLSNEGDVQLIKIIKQ